MIHKVEFHNFKALRDVSLDLERFTILVGPNGSGKTSILEGLHYLHEAVLRPPRKIFPSVQAVNALTTSGVRQEMSLFCQSTAGWVRLAKDPDDTFVRPAHIENYRATRDCVRDGTDEVELEVQAGGELSATFEGFGPAVFLRLDVKHLVAPSYIDEPVPQMEPGGEGLASVLAYMASNQPGAYEELVAALREVIPVVRTMRFPRAPVKRLESEVITVEGKTFTHRGEKEYWGNSIEFDMEGAPGIPAHMVSEGTLLVLGVLTVIMGPNRPRLVLLDDIDRALHPKAQEDLVGLLRKLLDQSPEMQIVATSHSPYLLDHLRSEEVRLTTLKDDGSVAAGRLDEHPEFEKWKETMTPGEFWSLVGEKWLVEAEAGERG